MPATTPSCSLLVTCTLSLALPAVGAPQGPPPGVVAQAAYLKASNAAISDAFGINVAISGDTLVVGAPGEDSSATGVNGNQADDSSASSGALYVFVRDGGGWIQQAYIKASNPDPFDNFGGTFSISGDTIVAGATGESSGATGVNANQADNSAVSAGAAYVFERNGTTWSQQAYLKASNTEALDQFGISVAVSGDTIVVGATREGSSASGVNGNQNDNGAPLSGAAYVFVRNGTTWSQQAYLKASNPDGGVLPFGGDRFGSYVAISGDRVAVAAPLEGSNATGIDGDQSDNSSPQSGAVYLFARSGTSWTQEAYVKASKPDALDRFGVMALDQNTLVVGAPREASGTGHPGDDTAPWAGAAYVFTRDGAGWSEQGYLKPSSIDGGDLFGGAVGVSGDWILVSAEAEDSDATGVDGDQNNLLHNAGAAYLFERQGADWNQVAYIKASNTDSVDGYGRSVAISGTTAIVGAHWESSAATGVNGDQSDNSATHSGAAYVYEGTRTGTRYCSSLPNTTGFAAEISAHGLPNSSLVLTSSPVPDTLGLFFFGHSSQAPAPFGDGLLCVRAPRVAMLPQVRGGMMQLPGTAQLVVNYSAPYASLLGGTRFFQYWFRSGAATGSGHNTSDGLTIVF